MKKILIFVCAYIMSIQSIWAMPTIDNTHFTRVDPATCEWKLFDQIFKGKKAEKSKGYNVYSPSDEQAEEVTLQEKSEAISELLKYLRYLNCALVGLLIFFITLQLIIKWGHLAIVADNPQKRAQVISKIGTLIACVSILSASSMIISLLLAVWLPN